MMTDIVGRLRRGTGDGLRMYDWCNEAADEIERLRRIIYNLLDDGDEADRTEARIALGEEK